MDFISNQECQIEVMLKAIGINSLEELFSDIPHQLRVRAPKIDDGLSELEGMRLVECIAAKNTFPSYESYLGAGAYEHHIPALVNAICSKSEFLTSYTPYQAEASQGMLQVIFEYQSAICALTGMDVANASLYDGASACAEAVLMALRLKNDRRKILISRALHPHYREVIQLYLRHHDVDIIWIPYHADGRLDDQAIAQRIDEKVAAVLVQSPNFFGVIEDIEKLITRIHAYEGLAILCGNPLAYGIYACPGELGIDIAVGDTQPFGLPLQFGGPYAGYMACDKNYLRQLPGRIVGETVDSRGRKGFVLTLQAREQHIRREKATSNICTNQALAALAGLVAILWYGKEGISRLALTNFQRAAFLKDHLEKLPGIASLGNAPIFNEFAIRFDRPIDEVLSHFRRHGIEPGVNLEAFFPDLKGCLLVAVTELKEHAMLNNYLQAAASLEV